MKSVTKELVQEYKLNKFKIDFMGFYFKTINDLDFHHFLVQKHECQAMGCGKGYFKENGVILGHNTSHQLLHTIERLDVDIYYEITALFFKMKINEALCKEDLLLIQDMLNVFIREHEHDKSTNNRFLITSEMHTCFELGKHNIKKRL